MSECVLGIGFLARADLQRSLVWRNEAAVRPNLSKIPKMVWLRVRQTLGRLGNRVTEYKECAAVSPASGHKLRSLNSLLYVTGSVANRVASFADIFPDTFCRFTRCQSQ